MAYRLHFMMGCHHENGYIALGRVTQTGTIPSDPAASIPPAPRHTTFFGTTWTKQGFVHVPHFASTTDVKFSCR